MGLKIPTDSEIKMNFIRNRRNSLLELTDWYACSDLIMSEAMKKYRQDLRDLPAQNTDPDKIKWPENPNV